MSKPLQKEAPKGHYPLGMTKRLRKTIMKRSELKSLYLMTQSQDSI